MGSRGKSKIARRDFLRQTVLAGSAAITGAAWAAAAGRGVTVVTYPDDLTASRLPVGWAVSELQASFSKRGIRVQPLQKVEQTAGDLCIVCAGAQAHEAREMLRGANVALYPAPEAMAILPAKTGDRRVFLVCGGDPRGLVYAVLELADRVNHAGEPFNVFDMQHPTVEHPANKVRSVDRCFVSEVEDKAWYNDHSMWRDYLTMLATQRFNRFTLSFGLGYDYPHPVKDAYFYFPYPFLLAVPGYNVRAVGLPDEERDRNLEMLRFISRETAARGMEFMLGLWTHAYQWPKGSDANYTIEGLTPETQAPYCRDALRALLDACPDITGLALRIHGESGIPESNFAFWQTLFEAITESGRRIEINMHAKGMSSHMVDMALATHMPVTISPKYWAEHDGLPYQPSSIRQMEMPPRDQKERGFFALSSGARRFLRYSYGDLLKQDRQYEIIFRIWPGTQRCLLWGDPVMAAGDARAGSFCGSLGMDLFEPLSFKGRHGSGLPGGRCAYADSSLKPRYDWEKFLYTYRVWGRNLYTPDTNPDGWRRLLRTQFRAAAPGTENALANASRILRLVTTARGPSAANNVYWPEIYTNMPVVDAAKNHLYRDTLPPKSFDNVSSFDPEMFLQVNDFATEMLKGTRSGKYSPIEVAQWLEEFSNAAVRNLAKAKSRITDPHAPDFRRMATDVAIQTSLGLFFAWKIRSGTLYALYEQTQAVAALAQALQAYRRARTHWAAAARQASGVYMSDITYGIEKNLRGNWSDRLPAIDDDITDMENRLAKAKASAASAGIADAERLRSAIREVLSRPARVSSPCRHVAPTSFQPGGPLPVELSVEPHPGLKGITARLIYRHVNQGEYYESQEMQQKSNRYRAVIPASYTQSPYQLQYFFELRAQNGLLWLFPGIGPHLSNQPYFVVEQA
jgi:hypothetical protein